MMPCTVVPYSFAYLGVALAISAMLYLILRGKS
jgi:hypothetical protein